MALDTASTLQAFEVRPVNEEDFDGWLVLWEGYNVFYRNEVTESVTRATFRRLCEGADGFFGLVAADASGQLVGLAHAIFHPSTWTESSYCYLEDLFVSRSGRGSGIARASDRGRLRRGRQARGGERVLAHPGVQRPGPLALRSGRTPDLVRGLREMKEGDPRVS